MYTTMPKVTRTTNRNKSRRNLDSDPTILPFEKMDDRIRQAAEFLEKLKHVESESKDDARYIVCWHGPGGNTRRGNVCTLAKIRFLMGAATIGPGNDWLVHGVKHWLVPVNSN